MGAEDGAEVNSVGEGPEETKGIKRADPKSDGSGEVKRATKSTGRTRATKTTKPAGNGKSAPKKKDTVTVTEVISEKLPLGAEYTADQEDLELSIEASALVIALLNGGANLLIGPHAAMNDLERGLIEPPLGRLLKKYGITPERVSGYSDPVLLLIGFGSWFARVKREQGEKEMEEIEKPEGQSETEAEREPERVSGDVFANMTPDELIFNTVQSNVS